MTVILSEKELALCGKYSQKERPTYYSVDLSRDVSISEDMEKFIILAPQETRSAVGDWVRHNKRVNEQNSARDSLLQECLQLEKDAAQAQVDELNQRLDAYNKFHEKYFKNVFSDGSKKDTAFGEVPDVRMFLDMLSRSVDEILSEKERANHLVVLMNVLQTLANSDNLTSGERDQINSLSRPFLAYTNGNK